MVAFTDRFTHEQAESLQTTAVPLRSITFQPSEGALGGAGILDPVRKPGAEGSVFNVSLNFWWF